MVIIVIGLILIGIGIGLLFAKKGADDKALNMKFVETTSIKEILENAQDIISSLGSGNFSSIVEVKGTIECEEPLNAEYSGTECVYYSTRVEREYETEEERKDSQGNVTKHRVRKHETVSSNSRSVPFYINDGTGQILLDMGGSAPETIQTHSRFERDAPMGYFAPTGLGYSKTLGYRYTEYSLPVNQRMYILGEANDHDGELRISKPKSKDDSFIVSTKTEEQLIKSAEGSSKAYFIGSIALMVVGVGVIFYGIFKLVVG